MHAVRLLQTTIEKSCPIIHKKRSDCLFDVVSALIDSGKLWISALGRGVKNQTTSKHNIKKVDTAEKVIVGITRWLKAFSVALSKSACNGGIIKHGMKRNKIS